MPFNEFLQLIKVIKMLYGANVARKVFEKNINTYYNLNSESILNAKKESNYND